LDKSHDHIDIKARQTHRTEMESYRPIALASNLEKVFKRIILTRLKWFLESQNLVDKEKAGFRNMLTSNSLMRFVQDVKQGL